VLELLDKNTVQRPMAAIAIVRDASRPIPEAARAARMALLELPDVWLWNEWPDRWGADAGIDLVGKDRHGHLWAIQAKAYDVNSTITRRDVDTFLAESGRPQFSFRLFDRHDQPHRGNRQARPRDPGSRVVLVVAVVLLARAAC
jgi:hypothetical protein